MVEPPVPLPTRPIAWPQRLVPAVVLFVGGCVAFLPYSLHPFIAAGVRLPLWGGIAVGLLAIALWARRSGRFRDYWWVLYALFVAAATNLADWFLSDWLTTLLGIEARSPAGYAVATFESMLVVVVLTVALIRLAGGDLASLYLRRGKVRWWLPIGLAAMVFFAVTAIPAATGLFKGQALSPRGILPWLPWILLFVLSNGLREELWFRGLLLPRYTPHLGAATAIVTTSLIFALAHMAVNYTPTVLFFLGITFVLGLMFATLTHKTDSLWGAVLFHAGADIPVIIGILSGL